jgi:hypothetical protein
MATRTSIHGARDISAESGGTTGAPLSIQIRRDYPAVYDEITLFTEDQALSRKLADVINETIAAHKAEQTARHRDVKPFGPGDTVYREFHIGFDGYGFSYSHDDYDGAPDANDNRCGVTGSLAEAKERIDEWWDDRESAKSGASGEIMDMHDKTIAMVKAVAGME